MNSLITITQQLIGTQETNAVDARELHHTLEIGKDFSNWIKAQINRAGLALNIDFMSHAQKGVGGKFDRIEYILTMDSAKHISMMSQSKKGKEVRDYFIAKEKELQSVTVEEPLVLVARILETVSTQNQNIITLLEDRKTPALSEFQYIDKPNTRRLHHKLSNEEKFIEKVIGVLKKEEGITQSELLYKVGKRKDDKSGRRWLHGYDGIYWRANVIGQCYSYSLIEEEVAS